VSRNFSRTTYNKPDLEEICSVGMGLRAKLVIEKKYDEAKQVFARVLEMCPNDVEIMTAIFHILLKNYSIYKNI
jgi:hypothetical protein